MNNQSVAKVTLHNTTGNSDKIYECEVVQAGDLYLVKTQNGRRGGSMTPRTKTKEPVSLEAAMKIYNGVVRDKKADNYFELESGNTVAVQTASDDPTGAFHQPQLLNDIRRDTAMTLIEDDDWILQEKMDGKRIAVAIRSADVRISNKSARACSIPESIVKALQSLNSVEYVGPVLYFEADGELVYGKYHVFDIFAIDGADLRQLRYEDRAAQYTKLFERNKALSNEGRVFDAIEAVETFSRTDAKVLRSSASRKKKERMWLSNCARWPTHQVVPTAAGLPLSSILKRVPPQFAWETAPKETKHQAWNAVKRWCDSRCGKGDRSAEPACPTAERPC